MTGEPVAGPDTLPEAELAALRADPVGELHAHPLDDDYYRERSADLGKITVPVLSAANWAHCLHSRGNFEGYTRVSSEEKWLEVHGEEHFTEFYTDYGVALQKRFFGHFLKGEDWLGHPTPGPIERPQRRRDLPPARRTGMAVGAHTVDKAVSRHHTPLTAD